MVSSAPDIEELKRTEEALRRSQADLAEARRELQLTIDTIPALVVTFDPDGTRDFVNRTWQDYTGLTLQETTGEGRPYFHHDDTAGADRAWSASLASGEPFSIELRIQRADGAYRWHFIRRVPLRDDAGKIIKWYGVAFDIDDRVRAQDELQRVRADFAHAARISMLGELTASIAHEINQPLAAIAAGGEASLRWLARPKPEVDEVRELTTQVVADARRASEIIGRIRAMATRRVPEQTLLSLDDIIREALLFLRHEVELRGVAVSHFPALPPQQVFADRTQLQQVIVNLVINAVQAVAQSGSTNRNIIIRTVAQDPDATLHCSVEDSGSGIEPHHITRLFESFFSTKDSGMGMGLRICRSVIEAHGGRIAADNESSQGGARFYFTLPVARTAP